MNSSQGPTTEQLAGGMCPALRGSWQDYLAVTNILPVPSLALNKLILRTQELSQQWAFSVNSETQCLFYVNAAPSVISDQRRTGPGGVRDH